MTYYQHILTYNSTSKILDAAPAGWEEFTNRLFRHNTYKSVLREDALSQRFVKYGVGDDGGYQFILDAYESEGTKANITYERKVRNIYTNQFDSDYTGVLDLNPDSGFSWDDEFVEVKIIDTSTLAKFSARDEIDVNVLANESIDGVTIPSTTNNGSQDITYLPIDIYLRCDSDSDQSLDADYTNTSLGEETQLINYEGNVLINEMGDRVSISETPSSATIYTNDLDQESIIQDVLIQSSTSLFGGISCLTDVQWELRISYLFEVYDNGGSLVTFKRLFIYQDSGTGPETFVINESGDYDFGTIVPTLTIPVGGRIDFAFEFTTNKIAGTGNIITRLAGPSDVSLFTFTEKTNGRPDNDIKGFLLGNLFTKALQLITSNTTDNIFESDLLQNALNSESGLFLTSGYQLRQLDKAININIKDLFNSVFAMLNVGMWYDKSNNKFELKEIENYYLDESYSFVIEDVSDLNISLSPDDYWNQLLGGYPKSEYEDFQGVNEFNNTIEHSADYNSKTKNNIRSTYYGDSIGAELARRKNKDQFLSEDTKYDENNYIHLTDKSEVLQLGSTYSGFAGIEQYYNPGYTPRQNILKHTNVISAQYFKEVSGVIRFRKSQKDTDITYSGTSEHDNITSSEFDTPLFYPEIYEFEGTMTNEQTSEIRTNPHKYIPFTDRYGTTRYGYINSIEIQDHKKTAKFVLIRANINR
jgi:hypothetical protein